MFLAKVEGSVVATKKDPGMSGRKLLLLRPQLVDEKDPTKFRPGMNTVVAVDKSFKSKVLDTDDKFSFTFAKPGTFDYFCSIHPHMTGKVVVKAS